MPEEKGSVGWHGFGLRLAEDVKRFPTFPASPRTVIYIFRLGDYFAEVVSRVTRFDHVDVFQYGELDYRRFGSAKFPLYGARSKNWNPANRMVLVTGGVHGYETSGVMGALQFIEKHFSAYEDSGLNILVLPCVSPWGFEQIQRWNPSTVDPN
eukprot:gene3370-3855_t